MPQPRRTQRWDATAREELLARQRLFRSMQPDAISAIAQRMLVKPVAAGGFVFLEGQPAAAVNLLAEGRVKVVHETDEGREVILRLIEPGAIFGGAGGWGDDNYPASAVAIDDAIVLQLSSQAFLAALGEQPALALALIQEVASRLRESEARIQELQTERVERRIARALIRIAGKTGVQTETGIDLGIPLTRQALADLCGTTLSTASRVLSKWDRQGLIIAGRERVTIVEMHELVALAEDLPGHHESL